ncbi:hypothetical protein LTS18_002204, partial [Coniosporium uncinatum]
MPLFGLKLIETKVHGIKFLASGIFEDEERFLAAVYASADRNSNIADVGDDILKRSISNINLEDPVLVDKMYAIYLGSRTPEGPWAVRAPLKVKLLTYLSRSVASTTFPAKIRVVVEEGLASASVGEAGSTSSGRLETSKLRSAVLTFAKWVVQQGSTRDIKELAEGFVARFRSFILDQGWPTPIEGEDLALRRYAYEVIGLASKASKVADIDTL